MNEREKLFAETIKNRMASELSDETLNMIWGWKNKVQYELCDKCKKEGRIDLLREMIDELSRDAVAKDLVNKIINKAIGDENGGNN
ncbi:MAG: hypothetical protein HKP41_12125 [Desulfobacterales bacterium]|nr:hypothetical protein [Desulfobacterales bacterium]